jgi:hypothetical protein
MIIPINSLKVLVSSLLLGLLLISCGDKEESETEDSEDKEDIVSGDTPADGDDVPTQPPLPPLPDQSCDDLDQGETFTRTRYQAASATLGLESCVSESQTCTCSKSEVSCDGTYSHSTCSLSPATISPGDILLAQAPPTSARDITFGGGSIVAFSKTGQFKGTVAESNTDKGLLTSLYGMKLERDPVDFSEFYLTVGTYKPGTIERQIHQFPETITAADTVTLSEAALVSGTETISTPLGGAFGFSVAASNRRYSVGGSTMHFYTPNGLDTCEFTDFGGKTAYAVSTGMVGLSPVVASINSSTDEFAIDRIGHCSEGGPDPTATRLFDFDYNTFLTASDIVEFYSFGGTWHKSIFVARQFGYSGGHKYSRYAEGTPYVEDTSPFQDQAYAMHYLSNGGVGKKIWTLESDGTDSFIRRYDDSGALEETIYTDVGNAMLEVSHAAWMVVIPE